MDGMERMDDRPVSGRTHPAPRLGSDRAVYERSSSGSLAKFTAMRGASSLAEFSAQVYSIAQRVPFRADVSNRPGCCSAATLNNYRRVTPASRSIQPFCDLRATAIVASYSVWCGRVQTTSTCDDGIRGERRQTIRVDAYRLGGAACRHDVVRGTNATFLDLVVGPGPRLGEPCVPLIADGLAAWRSSPPSAVHLH